MFCFLSSRRFWQIKIYELLRLLQLKLVDKSERAKLKQEGNNDMSRLFIDYDYLTGTHIYDLLWAMRDH
jgi:hypothetical protein